MDSSPLIKAHDHARAAAIATQTSDTTVAINEHTLAAGEFASAAQATSSIEALRTLRLLEQHHKRLSELLKIPLEPPSQSSVESESETAETEEKDSSSLANRDGSKAATNPGEQRPAVKTPSAKPVPVLPPQRRYPSRDLSSSIASNLASARGIKSKYRGQPLTPSLSNEQAPGSFEVSRRPHGPTSPEHNRNKPSWTPSEQAIKEDSESVSSSQTPASPAAPSEDGFSRFYSTFGSLLNRLSAPLVFAGLPLVSEESTADTPTPPTPPTPEPPRHSRSRRSTSAQTSSQNQDPDLAKIFSRATLRALQPNGPADSFYVVPTSGHTASYASILNHDNKERRRMVASLNSADDDDDDFVDARESQPPTTSTTATAVVLPPSLRKRLGGLGGGSKTPAKIDKEMVNAMEELSLENVSLKEMLDKLSKRLHAFELNSQSTHLALAQSLRLQRPGSPMSSSSGGAGGASVAEMEALRKRNKELEDQLGAVVSRMAALEKDHDKLQQTVGKYRERWEMLKAGAKARRGGSTGDSGGI